MTHVPATHADDFVAAFQIENEPVRGRVVRLGGAVDDMLGRHGYPEPVADLMGEAVALAALVGSSLKFEGRLIVQAQGDGPVSLAVVDYGTDGSLRGYCRYDEARVAAVSTGFARPGAKSLLGKGTFAMTIDQGPDMERYQGITPIEGESLALCAETYFAQSEQTPTRVRLAVGRVQGVGAQSWRAGGVMIQLIAADDARGDTTEAWNRAQALFETTGEDELIDPTIAAETLLFRLFHEDGVRMFEPKALRAECRCSEDRIRTVIDSFTDDERRDMVEADGRIHVTCEYCSRVYDLSPQDA